jgi:excisionase family DNA binding protein
MNGLDKSVRANFNITDRFLRGGNDVYLNVQRAALRLGVAPHTVRRWTSGGLLPCTRTAGGHRRIRSEDVDALAQQIGGSNHLAARRAREREVETLLETSLALVGQLELPDLLRETAERLTRLMDCHFCAISAYDAASQSVTMLADFDDGGHRLPDVGEYSLSRYPATRRVLEEQVPGLVNVGDPAADQHEVEELTREGDKSLLLVPLVFRGRSIGLVELIDHARERRYSAQELRLCMAVAGQAAAALHNAKLFSEAGEATRDVAHLCELLEAMGDAVAGMAGSTDADSLLEAAARAGCDLFGATSCVASARGTSAGCAAWSSDPVAGAGAHERRRFQTAAAEVLTVDSASGEVGMTLSLSRPSRQGEGQLLSLLATAAGACLRRLP